MPNKIIVITLILIGAVAAAACSGTTAETKGISKRELRKIYEKYSIVSKKDSSFHQTVERILVIPRVEAPLIPVYANSLRHSLESAFQSNGVVTSVLVANSPEPVGATVDTSGAGAPGAEARMLISIKPVYRERTDGHQAIVGAEFEVSLIDAAAEEEVWHATGKVNYIRDHYFSDDYVAHQALRREFAFNTTRAIVSVFIAEVNGHQPLRIYSVNEDRIKHGQRAD